MKTKVSLSWLIVVLLIAIIGIAVMSCAPPGYNSDAGVSPDYLREQVKVMTFNDDTCYVYVGYGISCVSND